MIWILDASAIICWLRREPGWQRVRDVLSGQDLVLLHAVNLVEVLYHFRRIGTSALQTASERIAATPIVISRVMDDVLLETASKLKAEQTPIALGDVFAVALTIHETGQLLTTDRSELEKIATAGICSIEFLR